MNADIHIDVGSRFEPLPGPADLRLWAEAALQAAQPSRMERAEISVRVVDEAESQELNARYRDQDKATNVLSFPADLPPELGLPLLGDLVICAPVVALEAREQDKTLEAHWAHMMVHGVLHLLGYDHITDADANVMEALETRIITQLHYPAPYADASADNNS